MAHNAAYYQQPQQQVYSHYPQQPQQQPQFQPQAQPQQPPAAPPNIYQQVGLQQPQPGRVPPRPYQNPNIQRQTQLAIQEYQHQYQQHPLQPVYAQQYVQQPQYQQVPGIPRPPPSAPPVQRIPSSQSIPATQSQFQSSQSAYPPAAYQLQHSLPRAAPPPGPVHAHSQSLPGVPISLNPISLPPHASQVPLPQQIQTPTSVLPQPTPGPTAGRRPLPFVQRGDTLPPLPLDTALASNPSPGGAFNSPRAAVPTSQQIPSPQDRGPPTTWNEQVFGRALEATSPAQLSQSNGQRSGNRPLSTSQITSSFAAGATSTRAQVPPSIGIATPVPVPQAVKSPSPTRRPLPSPADGNATKHQSIDLSRFSNSSPIKIGSSSVVNTRSSSPVKFPITSGNSNLSSRDGSVSPTKRSDSPTRIVPTPSNQSDALRRRASPPRWPNAESDRSRSVSPAKPSAGEGPRIINATSKNPSTPNTSSFAAARSIFSSSSSNTGRPAVSFSQNTTSPPAVGTLQNVVPASPPKKTIPVWKRTLPDPGDGRNIDFIGKSTFNPAQHIDPIIPGSAYAKALARAKVPGSAVQVYGAPQRPSMFPIAAPQGQPQPPYGYGYVPPKQIQGVGHHQRHPNSQEFDGGNEEDDEESQSEDDDSEDANRGRKGRKDKGNYVAIRVVI
ncbi:hypothetical protein BDN72DRAFT_183609 [Pluteus cervinus]|uniref:Uncharacterized protein n=1 Tax=Pluteus cervinus TaxID=181527 RepID=A0ACD3B6M5_9AGAR|nr:hypothetical protein BDN72DRAFT_183609 [Pluteus cervinus]